MSYSEGKLRPQSRSVICGVAPRCASGYIAVAAVGAPSPTSPLRYSSLNSIATPQSDAVKWGAYRETRWDTSAALSPHQGSATLSPKMLTPCCLKAFMRQSRPIQSVPPTGPIPIRLQIHNATQIVCEIKSRLFTPLGSPSLVIFHPARTGGGVGGKLAQGLVIRRLVRARRCAWLRRCMIRSSL